MKTTEFNTLDAAFLNLDCAEEPWSVQLEMRTTGRIDEDRLAQAIRAAARVHPLARARLRTVHDHDTCYLWEIPEDLEHLPLTVADVSAPGALDAARSALQSRQITLDTAPPFAVTLAHHPAGDYVMLNLSHVAGDGLSAFRLMNSIARQYAGLADPVPDFDPLGRRDLARLAGSRTLAERLKRAALLGEHLWNSRTMPVRVKTRGADAGAPGYGFVTLSLTADETRQVMARREAPATINDLLLAGLILTIREWNLRHGGDLGRASIMMPVNLRPKDWWFEVITNFSSYVPVSLPAEQQTDLLTAMRAVSALTLRVKDEGAASTLIDLLELPKHLPAFVKRQLRNIVPYAHRTSLDTAVLSNLGRLALPPSFGDAGEVQEIWFSPPGLMPLGTSVGAASMGDRMFLTIRYRKAQFDPVAAGEFADLYRQVLLGV